MSTSYSMKKLSLHTCSEHLAQNGGSSMFKMQNKTLFCCDLCSEMNVFRFFPHSTISKFPTVLSFLPAKAYGKDSGQLGCKIPLVS